MFIRINGIQIFAHHGVYQKEIKDGNHFEIDIEVEVPDNPVAASDALEDVLDYSELYKTVIEISQKRRYNLLETFANDICKKLLESFQLIDSVTIKLRKIDPPIGGAVKNVEIELRMKR